MHLHSTVLHSQLSLVKSDVLHVRFPVPGVRDPGDHMLGDHDPAVLLPPVRGGLPLVVASVPEFGFDGGLPVRVLLPLLRHQAQHRGRGLHLPVLRLHYHHGLLVLPAHRHHRLHGLLLVRKKNLQRR